MASPLMCRFGRLGVKFLNVPERQAVESVRHHELRTGVSIGSSSFRPGNRRADAEGNGYIHVSSWQKSAWRAMGLIKCAPRQVALDEDIDGPGESDLKHGKRSCSWPQATFAD